MNVALRNYLFYSTIKHITALIDCNTNKIRNVEIKILIILQLLRIVRFYLKLTVELLGKTFVFSFKSYSSEQ